MHWITDNGKTSKCILNDKIVGYTYTVSSGQHAWQLGIVAQTKDIKTSGVCATQREAQQKMEATWQLWLKTYGLEVVAPKPASIEQQLQAEGLLP